MPPVHSPRSSFELDPGADDSVPGRVWRTARPEALRWAPWELDSSLFNGLTGETHLLGELPAATVRLLCRRPWTLEGLCAKLARACDVDDDDLWRNKMTGVLMQLEAIELIECGPFPGIDR